MRRHPGRHGHPQRATSAASAAATAAAASEPGSASSSLWQRQPPTVFDHRAPDQDAASPQPALIRLSAPVRTSLLCS